LIYLICFVLALSLVGNVQAQTATWTDAAPGDHLWSTPENWSEFPTPAHWVKVRYGPPGATIAHEGAEALKVSIGYEDGSALTVDGGTLTTVQYLAMGRNGASGTLNMIGGTITIGRDFEVGYTGSGTVNMTGGTINVARDFEVGRGNPGIVNMTGGTIIVADDFMIPEATASTAEVNLDGGTIIVNDDLNMRADGGTMNGTLNITAGTLIIDANEVSIVQGYIDNGWITAYGGNGTVQLDYDVTNEGQTTLKGVHKLNPNPVNGGTVAAGELELSWTLPDPCVPGQPVPVDVYFTYDLDKLMQFTDPASMQVVSQSNVTSVAVQTVPKTRYYWAVDTYIGNPNDPIFGPIFSFLADNVPPKVDAGADAVSWLIDGVRTENLDATVTDDEAYTVQWTVVSEPDDPNSAVAVIAGAEDTVVTLSASGEYVLKLEANDGEYTGSDTVTINVYNDSCEAAKSLPDFELLPGDINEDCIVDKLDIVILIEHWLQCNALDCDGLGL
jgi:hypothetical protein